MPHYETVLILRADLTEERALDTIAKVRNIIEKEGGQVLHYEDWGKKKLAYTIKRQGRGSYHMLQYQAPPSLLREMEGLLKLNEGVLRFMTVKLKDSSIPTSVGTTEKEAPRLLEKEASQEEAVPLSAEEV